MLPLCDADTPCSNVPYFNPFLDAGKSLRRNCFCFKHVEHRRSCWAGDVQIDILHVAHDRLSICTELTREFATAPWFFSFDPSGTTAAAPKAEIRLMLCDRAMTGAGGEPYISAGLGCRSRLIIPMECAAFECTASERTTSSTFYWHSLLALGILTGCSPRSSCSRPQPRDQCL